MAVCIFLSRILQLEAKQSMQNYPIDPFLLKLILLSKADTSDPIYGYKW